MADSAKRSSYFASVPDGSGFRVEPEYRIVSRPNGLWCAQVRLAESGTDTADCWYDITSDTTEAAANAVAVSWAASKRKVDVTVLDASPEFRRWLGKRADTVHERINFLRSL